MNLIRLISGWPEKASFNPAFLTSENSGLKVTEMLIIDMKRLVYARTTWKWLQRILNVYSFSKNPRKGNLSCFSTTKCKYAIKCQFRSKNGRKALGIILNTVFNHSNVFQTTTLAGMARSQNWSMPVMTSFCPPRGVWSRGH